MTILTHDDNDSDYAGMTLTAIYHKHRKLRGTDDLRYPGERRLRCQAVCNHGDMTDGEWGNRKVGHHQCFLGPHADGDHEYSSECGGSRFREVVQ